MNDDEELRILSFTELESGWLDGEGDPINQETADLALEVFTSLENAGVEKFRTYPTPDGEVQFEWREGSVEKQVVVFSFDVEKEL